MFGEFGDFLVVENDVEQQGVNFAVQACILKGDRLALDGVSDLVPAICTVFEQPIKTAPRMDLSRVARFVKPACAVRNEDSRYEIASPCNVHVKNLRRFVFCNRMRNLFAFYFCPSWMWLFGFSNSPCELEEN